MAETGLTEYDSKDPAPLAPERDPGELERRLTDYEASIFDRMQAVFTLRGLGSKEAVDVMGRALGSDPSALLRHEVAYVFGQMADMHCVPYLRQAAVEDDHPMVRHEAVEALGNIPESRPEPLLQQILSEDADPEVRESAELALANLDYLRDGSRL